MIQLLEVIWLPDELAIVHWGSIKRTVAPKPRRIITQIREQGMQLLGTFAPNHLGAIGHSWAPTLLQWRHPYELSKEDWITPAWEPIKIARGNLYYWILLDEKISIPSLLGKNWLIASHKAMYLLPKKISELNLSPCLVTQTLGILQNISNRCLTCTQVSAKSEVSPQGVFQGGDGFVAPRSTMVDMGTLAGFASLDWTNIHQDALLFFRL